MLRIYSARKSVTFRKRGSIIRALTQTSLVIASCSSGSCGVGKKEKVDEEKVDKEKREMREDPFYFPPPRIAVILQ
jgi:hypothetical protein